MIKKIKWHGKDGIDPTWELMPAIDFNDYRQYIFDNTDFAKVMRTLKLNPEQCSTGKYTHRMVCPFKFHKNGRERTSSFRFNNKKKTFVCFGCNSNGNLLDFLWMYCGGCEQYNLKRLCLISGLLENGEINAPYDYKEPTIEPPKETNYKILFDSGLLLRRYLFEFKNTINYKRECEWVDNMFVKIDKYFNAINEDNIEDSKKIFDNLNILIEKRKKGNKIK